MSRADERALVLGMAATIAGVTWPTSNLTREAHCTRALDTARELARQYDEGERAHLAARVLGLVCRACEHRGGRCDYTDVVRAANESGLGSRYGVGADDLVDLLAELVDGGSVTASWVDHGTVMTAEDLRRREPDGRPVGAHPNTRYAV